jgi:hypothetical protein
MNNIILETDISHGVAYGEYVFARSDTNEPFKQRLSSHFQFTEIEALRAKMNL